MILERIKSASDALQVMDKVIRFSHQFDNEELCESIVKVIESLQDLQILRRRQRKNNSILYKEINSHVAINQLFFYFLVFLTRFLYSCTLSKKWEKSLC